MTTFKIENFKCFSSIAVPLARLNVLCGENSAGKSTIIQAFLLYRAALGTEANTHISITDRLGLSLGSSDNLLNQQGTTSGTSIKLSLSSSDDNDYLELTIPPDDTQSDNYGRLNRSLSIANKPKNNIPLATGPYSFVYLSAERNGPRLSQEKFWDEEAGEYELGVRGEYSAEVLLGRARTKIRDELVFPFKENMKGADAQLLKATQDWMSTIFGQIEIRPIENGHAPPSLEYKRPGLYSEWTTSTNVGFGISYCLPIILAGLLVPIGGILIIDSPEAHLHPAAQTALARYMAWVASSGANVIIETHSDHIIDGIRLASVTRALRLNKDQCSIINVTRDNENAASLKQLTIGPAGTLSDWPKGFFDQQLINSRRIAEAVRNDSR